MKHMYKLALASILCGLGQAIALDIALWLGTPPVDFPPRIDRVGAILTLLNAAYSAIYAFIVLTLTLRHTTGRTGLIVVFSATFGWFVIGSLLFGLYGWLGSYVVLLLSAALYRRGYNRRRDRPRNGTAGRADEPAAGPTFTE